MYKAFVGSDGSHYGAVNKAMVAFDEWQSKNEVVITGVTPTESQACYGECSESMNSWHTYTLLVAYREVQPIISPWHSFYNEHEAAWVIINRESKQEIALVGEYVDPRNIKDQAKMDAQAQRYAQLIAAAPQLLAIVEGITAGQPITQATIDTATALMNKIHN